MAQPATTYKFKNSEACSGVGIEVDGGFSHDVITITGYYPDEDVWARNLEAKEYVVVTSGIGKVALRGDGEVALDANIANRRAVIVPPGVWFRWGGNMTISMVCVPQFDLNKYEIKTESEIEGGET